MQNANNREVETRDKNTGKSPIWQNKTKMETTKTKNTANVHEKAVERVGQIAIVGVLLMFLIGGVFALINAQEYESGGSLLSSEEKETTNNSSTNMQQHIYKPLVPIDISLDIETLKLDQEVILTLDVTPQVNAPNSTIYISLPNEFELIEGNLSWNGDILKNERIKVNAKVKLISENIRNKNEIIEIKATAISNSRGYTFGKYDFLYINVTEGCVTGITHTNPQKKVVISKFSKEATPLNISKDVPMTFMTNPNENKRVPMPADISNLKFRPFDQKVKNKVPVNNGDDSKDGQLHDDMSQKDKKQTNVSSSKNYFTENLTKKPSFKKDKSILKIKKKIEKKRKNSTVTCDSLSEQEENEKDEYSLTAISTVIEDDNITHLSYLQEQEQEKNKDLLPTLAMLRGTLGSIVTLLNEDFEGSFPNTWTVGDSDSGNGNDY